MTEINPGGTHATWQEAIARNLEGLDEEKKLDGSAIKAEPIPDAEADATSGTKFMVVDGGEPRLMTGEQAAEGMPIPTVVVSATEPASPTEGMIWIDTSS